MRMLSRPALFVAVFALVAVAVACTDEATTITPTSTPLPAGFYAVQMGDNWFNGPTMTDGGESGKTATLAVAAGLVTLLIENDGSSIHNLHIKGLEKLSDALQLKEEDTLELGDLSAGEYDFVCDFHPTEMFGKLVVK